MAGEASKKEREEAKEAILAKEPEKEAGIVTRGRELGQRIIKRSREIVGSDGGESAEKKAASKSMGNVKFGAGMLGAGIVLAFLGSVALPFWGMKAILQADKHFMAGLKFFS